MEPVIVVHGGAWSIPDELSNASVQGVQLAAQEGYKILISPNSSALDAVEAAVTVLEDDPTFDAGTGSVLNEDGEIEMDAIIMEGTKMKAGAVACVQNIKNPVKLARLVMEKTDHVMLAGKGANKFAQQMGIEECDPCTLLTPHAREEWKRFKLYNNTISTILSERKDPIYTHSHETVGAVALDAAGRVACATSTGGITAKHVGRVGDSPLLGCGAFCDDEAGAVSCTGHGESITRICLARHIVGLMSKGLSAEEASRNAIEYMSKRIGGAGGVITVSSKGDFGLYFNTDRMAWASVASGKLCWGLEPGQREYKSVIH